MARDLDEPLATVAESTAGHQRMRYLVLGSACALAIITYIHRAGFQTNASQLLADLRMDDRDLGWMTVAFMIPYGLFEIPWGRLGDRFGARGLLLAIVLGGSLMTAGVALTVLLPAVYAVQIGFLVILRFGFGMFQAGTFPVLSRVLADWMPTTQRGFAQGLIWMSSRGGGVLAPILMGWLYLRTHSWRLPLAIAAALGLVWCVVVLPWFRNRPAEAPGGAGRRPSAHQRAPWRAILTSTNVWALWWMYGFLGYSGNFFLFNFATYLENFRGIDKETATWLTVAPFACGVFACIAGGALSDWIMRRLDNRRLGRRIVGASGLALAGTMILVSPWVENVFWLGVIYGLTFLGNDLSMGPAWAAASDIGERYAATISGVMNMMASLMAALAAIVATQFFNAASVAAQAGDTKGHHFYITLPFIIFAASYFLGALCWLRVDVTEPVPQGAD